MHRSGRRRSERRKPARKPTGSPRSLHEYVELVNGRDAIKMLRQEASYKRGTR